jgi:chemosensory pili system protein ChpA (sensor histidine kinase/response regulator)
MIAAAHQERSERDALPPELRESRAALLRVNADMIDRLRERGRASFRSRARASRARWPTSSAPWSTSPTTSAHARAAARDRDRLRSQMQSTLKAKEELGGSFDPLEMDRFSRMQELTRFLSESSAT